MELILVLSVKNTISYIIREYLNMLRLNSGVLVRVPGYRSRDPGSIPDFLRSGTVTGSNQPHEYN
jgi:hypothetical protein